MHPRLAAIVRRLPIIRELRWWQRLSWRADHLQANQALIARQLCGKPAPTAPEDPTFGTTSLICREAHFRLPEYHRGCAELQEEPVFQRKQWEFVYILAALERAGVLKPGARALGFGVGREVLPALFAARGIQVTATDQELSQGISSGWVGYGLHADGLTALNHPRIVAEAELRRLVSFRAVDMNHIPDDLRGYDFLWSACSLEHVGTLDRALAFVERLFACLRPGGIAVHTTEFNCGSDEHTITKGITVLLRRRDFVALSERLARQGHVMAPVDVALGEGFLDQWVDLPPFNQDASLRLLIERHVASSAGIIIRRAG
jgi:SAM-dependent methyltransferase